MNDEKLALQVLFGEQASNIPRSVLGPEHKYTISFPTLIKALSTRRDSDQIATLTQERDEARRQRDEKERELRSLRGTNWPKWRDASAGSTPTVRHDTGASQGSGRVAGWVDSDTLPLGAHSVGEIYGSAPVSRASTPLYRSPPDAVPMAELRKILARGGEIFRRAHSEARIADDYYCQCINALIARHTGSRS
jgi:hypothetical protein